MVSFSNADGARYDSVNDQSIVSSNCIPIGVKIPVQPSNFDFLHKGALLGAHALIEQIKSI